MCLTLLGITIDFRFLHDENAEVAIEITLFGILYVLFGFAFA